MFSATGFIQEYLRKHLNDWVVDIPYESVRVGLLDGDLQLSNLQLKKQSWTVIPGVSISLELGRVSRFNVQVPWSQLHTGLVNCLIDRVTLIFKLNIIDHESDSGPEASLSHDIKMALLAKEELRLLGDTKSKSSWLSRYMGSLAASLVSKIAANFNLTANNIEAGILIPKSEDEYIHVRVAIDAITASNVLSSTSSKGAGGTVDPSTERKVALDDCSPRENSFFESVDDCFLNKNFAVKGMTCKINLTRRAFSERDFASLERSQEQSAGNILINPCTTFIHLMGRKKGKNHALDGIQNLRAEIRIQNFEITPSHDQLYLAHEAATFINNERVKFQFQAIRALILTPLQNEKGHSRRKGRRHHRSKVVNHRSSKHVDRDKPRRSRANSAEQQLARDYKELWVFAIRAVLLMVKERRSGGYFQPRLSKGLERLGLRHKYLALYRKVIDHKLSLEEETRCFMHSSSNRGDDECVEVDSGTFTRSPFHNLCSPHPTNESSSRLSSKDSRPDDRNGNERISSGAANDLQELASSAPGLQDSERELFHNLHMCFNFSDLVLFRQTVHSEYLNRGMSKTTLRSVLTNNYRFNSVFRWLGMGKALTPFEKSEVAAQNDEFTQNVNTSRTELKTKVLSGDRIVDEEDVLKGCSVEFAFLVSRIAVTLLQRTEKSNLRSADNESIDRVRTEVITVSPGTTAGSLLNYSMPKVMPGRQDVKSLTGSESSEKLKSTAAAATSHQQNRADNSSPMKNSDRANADDAIMSFSVVMYNVYSEVMLMSKYDKNVKFSLGMIKCFGFNGANILDCGVEPNDYILANDKLSCESSVTRRNCFSFEVNMRKNETSKCSDPSKEMPAVDDEEIGSCGGDAESESGSTSSSSSDSYSSRSSSSPSNNESFTSSRTNSTGMDMNTKQKSLLVPSQKHYLINLHIEKVKFVWHHKSFHLMSELYHALLPASAMRVNSRLFSNMKLQAAELSSYQGCESINVPSKLSIYAIANGLVVYIPFSRNTDHVIDSSATRYTFRRRFTSNDSGITPNNAGRSIYLSFGKFVFASGDKLGLILPKQEECEGDHREVEPPGVANSPDSRTSSPFMHHSRRNGGKWKDIFSASQHHDEEGNRKSVESDRDLRSDVLSERALRECLSNIRSPIVIPVVFQVNEMELSIISTQPKECSCKVGCNSCQRDSKQSRTVLHKLFDTVSPEPHEKEFDSHSLSEFPWTVHGIVAPRIPGTHPVSTDVSTHLLCSPLKLTLTTQDIMCLIDSIREIKTIFLPRTTEFFTDPIPPRVERLAGLSTSFLCVKAELIDIEFLVEKRRFIATSKIIANALEQFGSSVITRGADSYVARTRQMLAANQLKNSGVREEVARSLISKLTRTLRENGNVLAEAIEHMLDELDMLVANDNGATAKQRPRTNGSKEELPHPLPVYCRPILFHLKVLKPMMVYHSLTYDVKLMVCVTELVIFDKERTPVLKLSCSKPARVEHFPHLYEQGEQRLRQQDDVDHSAKFRKFVNYGSSRDEERWLGSSGGYLKGSHRDETRSDEDGVVNDIEQFDPRERPNYECFFDLAQLKQHNCISFVYEEKAFEAEFGTSGHDISVLYKQLSNESYEKREGRLALGICSAEFQLATLSVMEIIEQSTASISQAWHHYSESKLLVRKALQRKREIHRRMRSRNSVGIFDSLVRRSSFLPSGTPRNGKLPQEEDSFVGSLASRTFEYTKDEENMYRSRPHSLKEKIPENDEKLWRGRVKTYIHTYEVIYSLDTSVQQLCIDFSFENHFLARCSMYATSVLVEDVSNLLKSRSITASVGSVSILDLSVAGSLHSEVVWRKNDNVPIMMQEKENVTVSDQRFSYRSRTSVDETLEDVYADYNSSPILTLSIKQTYSGFEDMFESIEVRIDVDGLRACCLYRFVLEMIDYFQVKLLAPFNQFLRSFEDHTKLMNRTSMEADDNHKDQSGSFYYGSISEHSASDSDYTFGDSMSDDSLIISDEDEVMEDSPILANSRPKSDSGLKADVSVEDIIQTSNQPVVTAKRTMMIDITLTDATIILPRNSASRDLVAFNVRHGKINMGKTMKAFDAPEVNDIAKGEDEFRQDLGSCSADGPLYFNHTACRWAYGKSKGSQHGSEISSGTNSMTLLERRRSSEEFSSEDRKRLSFSNSYAAKLLRQNSPLGEMSPGIKGSLSISVSDDADEHVGEQFDHVYELQEKNVDRLAIELHDVRTFISLSGPLPDTTDSEESTKEDNAQRSVLIDAMEHKVYREVNDNELVNTFFRKSKENSGCWAVNQAWREVTVVPFHLMIIFDQTPTVTKLLIGDTEVLSILQLNLSQSSFYLLMSLWFDNIHEQMQYPHAEIKVAYEVRSLGADELQHSDTGSNVQTSSRFGEISVDREDTEIKKMRMPIRFSLIDTETGRARTLSDSGSFIDYGMRSVSDEEGDGQSGGVSKGSEPKKISSTYGTKEFFQSIMNRVHTWEILVVRAEIRMGCGCDTNYFPVDIPNIESLCGLEPGSGPQAHMDTSMGLPRSDSNIRSIPMTHAVDTYIQNPHVRRDEGGGTFARKSYAPFAGPARQSSIESVQHSSSHGHAQRRANFSKWVNKMLPVCDINLSGLSLHIKMDDDVLQMSLGAGQLEVYDSRRAKKTLVPYALRIATPQNPTTKAHAYNTDSNTHRHSSLPRSSTSAQSSPQQGFENRRVYGTSNFYYGFNLLPSDVETPCDIPLRVSLVMATSTNWITTNIGMDMMDLNLQSLDLILLISDFFSCYFRFSHFGHPGVKAYNHLAEQTSLPYGGIDTRLFISRPHISLLKSPLHPHSQALLLEADGGLYYRYTLDTNKTVKMDLNIYNLALVLVKRFRPPSVYRGIRGSSGSGKGVRTLVEFFNIALAYHFITADNHLDLKVDIYSPPLDDDGDDGETAADGSSIADIDLAGREKENRAKGSYVDFDAQSLQLSATKIPYPHCVYPLISSKTDFTNHSCDIVSSYEDILFCIVLAQEFLKLNKVEKEVEKKHHNEEKGKKAFEYKARAHSNISAKGGRVQHNGIESLDELEKNTKQEEPPCEVFGVLSLTGIRLMIVDNVLGLHLPLIQIFLDKFQCTLNRIDPVKWAQDSENEYDSGAIRSRPASQDHRKSSYMPRRDTLTNELFKIGTIAQSNFGTNTYIDAAPPETIDLSRNSLDMMVYGRFIMWADYFNNMRKCWEPLFEKVAASILLEKSYIRGTGITLRAESAIHMNVSGAFFRTLNDMLVTIRSHQNNDDDRAKQAANGSAGTDAVFANTALDEPLLDQSFILPKESSTAAGVSSDPAVTMRRSSIAASPVPRKNMPALNRCASARPTVPKRNRKKTKAFPFSFGDTDGNCDSNSGVAASAHELLHIPSNPLGSTFRVGFSIENLTGQPVRYLQQWEGYKRTVQYLNHDERGLLNFVASKTLIRNGQVVEETFDVQMEQSAEDWRARNRRKAVGNRVALQVAGYRWLHAVQADELGVRYEELYSVLGRVQATQLYRNPSIANALKLMVEVLPYCGGRMLRLRSVFTIKNNTRHALKILAREGTPSAEVSADDQDAPFHLDSGSKFHVPLALLRRSVLKSRGISLGSLFLRPADIAPIEEELAARPNVQPGFVDYSRDPINLYHTMDSGDEGSRARGAESRSSTDNLEALLGVQRESPVYSSAGKDGYMQLSCDIHPKAISRYGGNKKHHTASVDYKNEQIRRANAEANKLMLKKLPPFCYCVEVQKDVDGLGDLSKSSGQGLSIASRFFTHSRNNKNVGMSPANFTITIHPPIVIENLLPCSGSFELVHAVQKRVLWSSWIPAGTAKSVHTVTLEEPMLLLINLKYCRSSEGALVHQPRRSNDGNDGIAGKFQRALDSLLEEGNEEEGITSVLLTDTVGQRLRLNVENTLGGGGQRQIAVYCPYWIVNTSQYSFRIIEEGKSSNTLPAGTVTAQKDGTRPVPHSGMTFAEMQLHSGEHDITRNIAQSNSAIKGQGQQQSHHPSSALGFANVAYPSMVGNTAVNTAARPASLAPTLNSQTSIRSSFANGLHHGHGGAQLTSASHYGSAYSFRKTVKHGYSAHGNMSGQTTQRSSVNNSAMNCFFRGDRVVFPGCYGPLHSLHHREFSTNSPLRHLIQELDFNDIVELSYMFNYASESSRLSSKKRVKVQLDDTEWSPPFGLDSVGVTQSVSVDHSLRGNLEVGFKINVAPGRLAKYTKIVRFLPKFTVVNKLDTPLRVLQPIGFAGDTKDIEVSAQHMRPYHLPASFADRKLALQVDGSWQRTVNFNIDQIGIFTMEVKRKVELADIQHVNTRGAAEYLVQIQPMKCLGIYFETDWGEENIVVKDIQKGSFAANETDIKVGDVLLSVDGEPLTGSSFELAMIMLKKCVSETGGVAKFRTVEEKIRLIRQTAWNASRKDIIMKRKALSRSSASEDEIYERMAVIQPADEYQRMILRVELRQIESSVMIVVNEVSEQHTSEYRIENQSCCYKMYYKQKGIIGNKWNVLQPGQSIAYVWEDPFKPHKLQVLLGDNILCPGSNYSRHRAVQSSANTASSSHFSVKGRGEDSIGTYWGYLAGMSIDQSVGVNLDEIGSKEMLAIPGQRSEMKMLATVKSEGPTKILVIAPSLDSRHMKRELQFCTELFHFQISTLQEILQQWASLHEVIGELDAFNSAFELLRGSFNYALHKVRSKQKTLIESDHEMNSEPIMQMHAHTDEEKNQRNEMLLLRSYRYPEKLLDSGIDEVNQLEVTVFEGKELTPLVVGKQEDVYCKIFLRADDLATNSDIAFSQKYYTYVSDQTLDPAWQDQKFVFNVPEKAAYDPRRYYLRIIVKARSIVGLDPTLGKMDIDLKCLQDERILEGWFPLRPPRMSFMTLTNATGSLKLRIQWIHSYVGFANYLGDETERRLDQLNLQLNVQRYALKQLQRQESNRNSFNAKKRRVQGKSSEKDYYRIVESLQAREKRNRHRSALFNSGNHLNTPGSQTGSISTPNSPATRAVTLVPSMSKRDYTSSGVESGRDAPGYEDGVPGAAVTEDTSFAERLSAVAILGEEKSDDDAAAAIEHIEYKSMRIPSDDEEEFDETVIDGELKLSPIHIDRRIAPSLTPQRSTKSILQSYREDLADQTILSPQSPRAKSRAHSGSSIDTDSKHELKRIPIIRHGHKDIMKTWKDVSMQHTGLHQKLSQSMNRSMDTILDNQYFRMRFDDEGHRNFDHVRTLGGELEITPMQALHLPESTQPMLVRVSYGEESQSTFRMPPAAYLTWYQEKSNAEVFSAREMNAANDLELNNSHVGNEHLASAAKRENSLNESLAKRFTIDTVNIRGMIRVSVMTEGMTKAKEVAYVELPVFNLLDCCLVLQDHPYYDRWFPLLVSSESLPIEGNMDRLNRQTMCEQAMHSAFEYQPCIRLRIRWEPSQDVQSIEDSKLYARVQVPCMSVGVVDSAHTREVMLAAVRGVEFRHAVATDFTDSVLNVTWLQIDNELPDPVAPVILSPTRQKHPQPAIRLRIRKKNLLSQSKLNSFERIELIVQELDLRLEQQTVVATWELVKSLLQEKKTNYYHNKRPNWAFSDAVYADNSQSEGTTLDTLGFATCNELVQYELLPTLENAAEFYSNPLDSPSKPSMIRGSVSSDFSDDGGGGIFSMYAEEDVSTMYIEEFNLYPIKLNVSFITTPQVMAPSHKRKRDSDMRNAGTVGLYSGLSLFFWQVGEVVLNLTSTISDAPIIFNGFHVPHMFKTESDVAKILQDHYLHSALGQLYKIVGSLELVGNPIGLLSSLGAGVKDFFYEPAHALFTSPTEVRKIGRSVLKGAMSLVSNTTDGFLGTGVNITRSIGRGVAKLSMDNAYMMKREDLMRPPTSLKDAALRPARDLGVGFYYGIVGLVKVPYNSVQRHGAKAFIPGVAKGIIGLAANPVVGVLDAVAHSGDAIRNVVKIANRQNMHPVQRLRLSEVFGPDGRILPYSYENAIGTQILHALDRSNEERIKVSSAINGGVGMLISAGNYLNPLGEDVALTRTQNRFGGLSHMNSISMNKNRFRRGSDSLFSKSRRKSRDGRRGSEVESTGMVVHRNRFSYIAASKAAGDMPNLHDMLGSDNASEIANQGGINPLNSYGHAHEEGAEEGVSKHLIDVLDMKASKEYVVYTALIRQDASMDLVAVLSTDRLVVTEYHHNKNGSFLRELWHSALDHLEHPHFERTGGKATLLLRSSGASISAVAAASARKQLLVRSGGKRSTITEANGAPTILESLDFSSLTQRNYNYLLVANYNEEDVIINMSNCIHVLLGACNSVIPTYNPEHSVCEKDEEGIVHIGPWQFAPDMSSFNYGQSLSDQMDSSAVETQAIIKELELEKWVHSTPSKSSNRSITESSTAPHWLTAEQDAAVEAHGIIREIFECTSQLLKEYNKSPRSKAVYKESIDQLYKGQISYEEFLLMFENWKTSNDDNSTSSGAALSKGKRLGKKHRKRSLFFGLGAGTDDGKEDDARTVKSVDSISKKRADSEDGSTIAKGVGSVITKSAKGISAAVAFTNRRFSDIMFARGTASTPVQEMEPMQEEGESNGDASVNIDEVVEYPETDLGISMSVDERQVSNRVPFTRAIAALTTSDEYPSKPSMRDNATVGTVPVRSFGRDSRIIEEIPDENRQSISSASGGTMSMKLDGWEAAVRLSNHLQSIPNFDSCRGDSSEFKGSSIPAELRHELEQKDDTAEDADVADNESSPGHTVVRGGAEEIDNDYFSYSHLDTRSLAQHDDMVRSAADGQQSGNVSHVTSTTQYKTSSKGSSFRLSGTYKPINLGTLTEHRHKIGGTSPDVSPLADSTSPSPQPQETKEQMPRDNRRMSGRFQPIVAGSNPLFKLRSRSVASEAAAPSTVLGTDAAVEDTNTASVEPEENEDALSVAARHRSNRQSHRLSAEELSDLMRKRVSAASTVASMLFSSVPGDSPVNGNDDESSDSTLEIATDDDDDDPLFRTARSPMGIDTLQANAPSEDQPSRTRDEDAAFDMSLASVDFNEKDAERAVSSERNHNQWYKALAATFELQDNQELPPHPVTEKNALKSEPLIPSALESQPQIGPFARMSFDGLSESGTSLQSAALSVMMNRLDRMENLLLRAVEGGSLRLGSNSPNSSVGEATYETASRHHRRHSDIPEFVTSNHIPDNANQFQNDVELNQRQSIEPGDYNETLMETLMDQTPPIMVRRDDDDNVGDADFITNDVNSSIGIGRDSSNNHGTTEQPASQSDLIGSKSVPLLNPINEEIVGADEADDNVPNEMESIDDASRLNISVRALDRIPSEVDVTWSGGSPTARHSRSLMPVVDFSSDVRIASDDETESFGDTVVAASAGEIKRQIEVCSNSGSGGDSSSHDSSLSEAKEIENSSKFPSDAHFIHPAVETKYADVEERFEESM